MDLLGKDVCIKCDKGGDVLICSTSSCPLAVHKKCLGCPIKFDEKGKFYCPYCTYRQLVEESYHAKERVLSRKKALLIFLDRKLLNGDCQTQEFGKSNCKEQTHPLDARKIYDRHTEDDAYQVNKFHVTKHILQDKDGQQDRVVAEYRKFVRQSQEGGVLCQGNHCNCLSTYDDIATASDKHHPMSVVGHRTLSGPIVACGQDCVDSKDEETVKRSKMVEIGNKISLQPQLKNDCYQLQRYIEIHHDANQFTLLPSEDEETENGYEMVRSHKNIPLQLQHKDCSYQPRRHDEYQLEGNHIVDPIVSGQEGKENFLKAEREGNDAKTVQKSIVKKEGRKQVEGQVNKTAAVSLSDAPSPVHLLEKRRSGADDSKCSDSESAVNGKRIKYDGESRDQSRNDYLGTFRKSAAGLRAYADNLEKIVAARETGKLTKLDSTFDLFNGRRKSSPWTDEEVNMLKESVRIFSTTVNKNIPWSKILSFGRHVFDGSRTPVDLKEKWRRLAKER